MNNGILGLSLLLLVGACKAPSIEPFTVIDFKGDSPIHLNVSSVNVDDKTIRYTDLPHIETRLPITPAYALKQALTNRFAAVSESSPVQINFIIQKADMTQKKQEAEYWYILNNSEFLLTYQIDVVYAKGHTIIEKQEIVGWEKQALPKKSSLSEKEAVWRKMIDNMIQKVTDKIQTDMPPLLYQ